MPTHRREGEVRRLLRAVFYLFTIELLAFPLGRLVPKTWFSADRFPFRHHAAEDGLYRTLKVRRWQNKLPDMSRIFPGLMPPKNLSGDFTDRLPLMISETCVAELTHAVLCVAGWYCIALCPGVGGWLLAIACFAVNFPYILIQRYNRPRLVRLLSTAQKTENISEIEKGRDAALCPSTEEKQ